MYDALGVAVLKNAWEGYNSTLFAYGQTGSGKSWSVVGYGINKGKHMAITGINQLKKYSFLKSKLSYLRKCEKNPNQFVENSIFIA